MNVTECLVLASLLVSGVPEGGAGGDGDLSPAIRIFERRILPIVRSERRSSCVECHFAGVDLAMYVTDDPLETFAALRAQGLVDPERPSESKLLKLIQRKPEKEDPVLARVRRAEYAAFLAWIRAAAADSRFRTASPRRPIRLGTELPPEVVRHARRDQVVARMLDTIWPEFGRCVSCHSPGHNERLVRKYGERMNWIVPHDPEGTLRRIVEQELIDADEPERSLLLLKPLAQEVEHGGGPKFVSGSRSDRMFREFLRDFAYVITGRYRTTTQLPPMPREVVRLTDQHLRIVHVPTEWQGKLLRVDVYAIGPDGPSEHRIATAENPVAPRRPLWQSALLATAPKGTPRAEALARVERTHLDGDRFLVRIYVDVAGRTVNDRDYVLGKQEHVADIVLEGPWHAGYRPPRIIDYAQRSERRPRERVKAGTVSEPRTTGRD